jgi:hypothetical protein
VVACGTIAFAASGSAGAATAATVDGVPVKSGAIQHVVVIDIENEDASALFGSGSAAKYLTGTLEPKGTYIPNYFAVGHVSADNYIAQVSGQAPNQVSSSDCITNLATSAGSFNDVIPGTLDANQSTYPGQVGGQGCVMPASVQAIGNQLDAVKPPTKHKVNWREYAEDMGNDTVRDGGTVDPLGGTDCAHPVQTAGAAGDDTNAAEGPHATGSQVLSSTTDQYADRHNPFIYFHSVIDNSALCNREVVPLGTVTVGTGGAADQFSGHLVQDLQSAATTPKFSFITPNLCDDGHDSTCAGTNTDGTTVGGVAGADTWLSHWMPLILSSPAYTSGKMLVVITSDEGAVTDTAAGDGETPGPNSANPGYSPLMNSPIAAYGGLTYYDLLGVHGLTPNTEPVAGTMPGGGAVGALVLNRKWVKAGAVDTTGNYNHYSALRTYEDLLGITTGGADGQGHLGFAATAHPFGSDVFTSKPIKG